MREIDSGLPPDWFARGDQDVRAAQILIESDGPLEIAGFHIQQAVEKYLKGYLLSTGWRLRRIHNLEELIRTAVETDQNLARFVPTCQKITQYYVESRYPIGVASELTQEEIEESLHDALEIIAELKQKTV